MDTLPNEFDVLLLGTSLPQSILAAALSVHGLSVLHVDPSPLYGSTSASLTISDLLSLPQSPPPYLHNPTLQTLPFALPELKKQSREYALSLQPMMIRSYSPLIDQLVKSKLSKQCAFQLVQGLFLYSPSSPPAQSSTKPEDQQPQTTPTQAREGKAVKVPSSKEDIFRSPLPLLTKRKLMRFLLWCAGGSTSQPPQHRAAFEDLPEVRGKEEMPLVDYLREVWDLDEEGARALTYVVAQRVRPTDPTLPGLQAIRQHLLGFGRYGPSAYLVGHYGGAGELAQLFCRMAAVRGAPYILGHSIERLELPSKAGEGVRIQLEGIDEVFRAKKVVMEPHLAPSTLQSPTARRGKKSARCLAVIEQTLALDEELDTALLVFPPHALGEQGSDKAVTCLWSGEGSRSTPSGKYAVYLSVPLDSDFANTDNEEGQGVQKEEEKKEAKELLQPYLQAFLQLTGKPEQEALLTFYYTFEDGPSEAEDDGAKEVGEGVYVLGGMGQGLVETADRAAEVAQSMFEEIAGGEGAQQGMWAGLDDQAGEDQEEDDEADQPAAEDW